MNILMITNTFTPHVGGVARSVSRFTQEYCRQGHRVLVIAPEFEGNVEDPCDVIRIPSIQNVNHTSFSIRAPVPLFLSKQLDRFQPDLVHSHHPFMLGGTALVISETYGIPLVFTYHTMYEEYTHYVPVNIGQMKSFVTQLALGYANQCDHVVFPSGSIQSIIKLRGFKRPSSVVPTGVDPQFFAAGNGKQFREDHNIPKETFVVGHVGRLAPEKNLQFLAQCLIRFLNLHPESYCLIAGEGPSKSNILDIFNEYGNADRLRLIGVASGKKLTDAYNAMNVFAFSSKTETQGMVLTEAMAAGVPVVALDAPGAREVVVDKINGRLLPEENIDLFLYGLNWIRALSPHSYSQLQKAVRSTADKFSIATTTRKLLALYEKLIRRQNHSLLQKKSTKFARLLDTELAIGKNWGRAALKALRN